MIEVYVQYSILVQLQSALLLALQLAQESASLVLVSVECILDHTDHPHTMCTHPMSYIHMASSTACNMTTFEESFQYNIQVLSWELVVWSPSVVQSTRTHQDHQFQSMSTLQLIHILHPLRNHYKMRKSSVNIQYNIPPHTQVLEWSESVLVAHTPCNHPFLPIRNLVPRHMIAHLPSCSRRHRIYHRHNSILELDQE